MKVRGAPAPTPPPGPRPTPPGPGAAEGGREAAETSVEPEPGPRRLAWERASEGGEQRRRCRRRHGRGRGPELGLVPEAGRPGRPEGLHCHGAGEGEGSRRGPLPAGARPSGLIPDAAARLAGPGAAGSGAA